MDQIQVESPMTGEMYCFKMLKQKSHHGHDNCIKDGQGRIQFNIKDRGFEDALKDFYNSNASPGTEFWLDIFWNQDDKEYQFYRTLHPLKNFSDAWSNEGWVRANQHP